MEEKKGSQQIHSAMEMQIRNRAAGDLLMGVGFEFVEGWRPQSVCLGLLKTGRAQVNDTGLTMEAMRLLTSRGSKSQCSLLPL